MILRFLKSNQAYHFILIPLVTLALWTGSYIRPDLYPYFEGEANMLLYKPLQSLLSGSELIGTMLAAALAVLLSFVILHLNTAYACIRIRTFLPSNIFILIIGGLYTMHHLHPVYFGALFLMLCIDRIFGAYENQNIHSNAFDAGFFIGLGSLFYFNLVFYFPAIWIGFVLIRKSPQWRNFALPFVGFLLPWLFGLSYYFLTDQLEEMQITISQNILTSNNDLFLNIHMQVFAGFLALLTLLGSFFLIGRLGEKKISSRKYFQILFVVFAISVILLVIVPAVSLEVFVLMAIPLAFLISNYLIFMRSRFWSNLFISIFIGLVIYLQFV